jgi:hypothetical protein
MTLRVTGALTALIGLAAFAGDAAAQYDPYRYPYVRGPYWGAPFPTYDEDYEVPRPRREVPGDYRREAPPYESRSYDPRYDQTPPFARRYEPPYDRRYEQAAPAPTRPSDVERHPLYDPYLDGAVPGDYVGRPGGRPPAPGDYATRQPDPPPGVRPPVDFGAVRPPTDIAPPGQAPGQRRYAALPPGDEPEEGPVKELPPHLRRQLVDNQSREPAGTIVIDTANTYLYLVLGGGKAMRYGIGVGREGFTWSGRGRHAGGGVAGQAAAGRRRSLDPAVAHPSLRAKRSIPGGGAGSGLLRR